MPTDRTIVLAAAGLVVLIALASMAALHERHYRDRRNTILEANLEGFHLRLTAVEKILREDRFT